MSDVIGELDMGGRTAVVTGGSNGIGEAIATALTQQGANVLVLDREPHRTFEVLEADLAQPSAVTDAARQIADRLGTPDILVNCAGVCPTTPLDGLDLAAFTAVQQVNLHAPVALMAAFGPAMARAGYGRMVNVSSVHATTSEPGYLAYAVSKAGLEAATRSVAVELGAAGVLANAVAPGFVRTRMSIVDGVDEHDSDWFRDVYVAGGQLPIAQPAMPADIAAMAAWLASDANSYVTGQTIRVDGGMGIRL
ncbi:MAG: SDR family NAD(P)-dependent oxidoreductase [Beutenbergiaceae bacterium]